VLTTFLLWTWHQALDFISLEVVEVFMYSHQPVYILYSNFDPERLNRRHKRVMLTKNGGWVLFSSIGAPDILQICVPSPDLVGIFIK
jgi:hypothetical protein